MVGVVSDNGDQTGGETPAGPASSQAVRLPLDHDPPLDRTEAPEVLRARHRAGIDPSLSGQFPARPPITESDSRFLGRVSIVDRLPVTYDEWKRCIEVDCSIPLTVNFCERRLKALRSERDPHTTLFRRQWGEDHLDRVVGWFEQALRSDARPE